MSMSVFFFFNIRFKINTFLLNNSFRINSPKHYLSIIYVTYKIFYFILTSKILSLWLNLKY